MIVAVCTSCGRSVSAHEVVETRRDQDRPVHPRRPCSTMRGRRTAAYLS